PPERFQRLLDAFFGQAAGDGQVLGEARGSLFVVEDAIGAVGSGFGYQQADGGAADIDGSQATRKTGWANGFGVQVCDSPAVDGERPSSLGTQSIIHFFGGGISSPVSRKEGFRTEACLSPLELVGLDQARQNLLI